MGFICLRLILDREGLHFDLRSLYDWILCLSYPDAFFSESYTVMSPFVWLLVRLCCIGDPPKVGGCEFQRIQDPPCTHLPFPHLGSLV